MYIWFSASFGSNKIHSHLFHKSLSNRFVLMVIGCAMHLFTMPCLGQGDVLMQHNDLNRTGWNNQEVQLDQANVGSGNFGRIFSRQVDDQIYAQPLVISGVQIAGGPHNIVLVATVNNSVYAFDADDPAKDSPYWHVTLTASGDRPPRNTDMTGACGGNYHDFSGNFGIVGTPALDTASHTLYVVARSVQNNGTGFKQYLHALDYRTGIEKPGSPVYITASVQGQGNGNVNGTLTFDPQLENQRPGLLLYDGAVFITWASHCDWGNYHGWVLGYDAATLQQKYIFNITPNGYMGGIWMSGQAPAVDDSGYIYLTTGNGSEGIPGNADSEGDRSEALVKLAISSSQLQLKDFFTPDNFATLDSNDLDYGCDGVLLIPGTRLSVSGSKQSYMYLVNTDHMGGITPDNSNAIQMLDVNADSPDNDRHIHGSPVYFSDPGGHEYIYAWAEDGLLKQFPFLRTTGLFDLNNVIIGTETLPYGEPGAMLTVSSNGSQAGSGILWASHPLYGDANYNVVPGVLQAFDATNIARKLWDSNHVPLRDRVGNFAKFVSPTVANGKVYVATFSHQLAVYGLNPPAPQGCPYPLSVPWQSEDIGNVTIAGNVCEQNGVFTVTASGSDIWNNEDAFHYVYQPFDSINGMITAKVEYMDYTDAWAKCGLMIRAGLNSGAAHAMMSITPGNGAAFQDRVSDEGTSYSVSNGNIALPYWVRIIRSNNYFTGYVSPDGYIWTAVDSVSIAMGSSVYAGIAYTSHDDGIVGTSIIDSVSMAYMAPPPPITAQPEVYPNPATYQVYVSDPAFIGPDFQIEIELLNMAGAMVFHQSGVQVYEGSVIRLSLPPSLPNGSYFIRLVNSRGKQEVKKLLILR
jgi:hypothetical protein